MNPYEEMLHIWDKLQYKEFLKLCIVDKPKKVYDEKTKEMVSIDVDIYHKGMFGRKGKLLCKFAIHLEPFGRWYVTYQPIEEKAQNFLGILLMKTLPGEKLHYRQSNQKEMAK